MKERKFVRKDLVFIVVFLMVVLVFAGIPVNVSAPESISYMETLVVLDEAKITASDGATEDVFGISVAISGDTVVVGAALDDDNGDRSGSVYVFVRGGISRTDQAKLTASDGAARDMFGVSVAISGETVVVGAGFDDDNGYRSGSAYIFIRSGTTWTEQAKLTASDGAAGDFFGGSVTISDNTVSVGAPGDDDSGDNSGSAYVFVRSGTTWTEQAKLTPSDGAAGDGAGGFVAISGDTVVVGAYRDDDSGDNSGSAYIFVRSGTTWTEQAKLTASDGAAGDEFGYSIVISGDTVVVGADYDDDDGDNSGSAYIFERSGTTWTEQAKLTASDGAAGDEFGTSVAISGDTVVVGSYFDDDVGDESGSAYIYLLEDGEAPPENVIQDVMDDIVGMELPKGTENSLISILQNVLASLEKENYNAATNKINAFINEVEAQSGKKITEEEAEYLILVGHFINEAILESK